MSEQPHYGKANVIDIVSYGYGKAFANAWTLTKLSLGPTLFISILAGFIYPEILQVTMQTIAAKGRTAAVNAHMNQLQPINDLISMMNAVLEYYMLYVMVRYTKDVFHDKVDDVWYNYLKVDKSALAFLGIGALFFVSMFIFIPLMAVGMLLLLLPGIAVLIAAVYIWNRFSQVWMCYLEKPEAGIIGAFKESWFLTANNVLRTIGMNLLVLLIKMLISLPFGIAFLIGACSMGFSLAMTKSLEFIDSPLTGILITLAFLLMYWALYTLGTGGMLFTWYRFYYDLKARQEEAIGA